MYLNLDLLYNTYNYIYPLFYYKDNYDYGRQVYSPMIKKSVYKNAYGITYSDYITKKYKYKVVSLVCTFDDTGYIFTENTLNHNGFICNKCKPFKLESEDLYFIKSNTRIN